MIWWVLCWIILPLIPSNTSAQHFPDQNKVHRILKHDRWKPPTGQEYFEQNISGYPGLDHDRHLTQGQI